MKANRRTITINFISQHLLKLYRTSVSRTAHVIKKKTARIFTGTNSLFQQLALQLPWVQGRYLRTLKIQAPLKHDHIVARTEIYITYSIAPWKRRARKKRKIRRKERICSPSKISPLCLNQVTLDKVSSAYTT